MGKAIQDLIKEHDSILYVLQILEKMVASDTLDLDTRLRYYGEVVYFLKIFADKCHHGKEENILFNELVSKGIKNENGPIGVMLAEHFLGREYVAQMNKSVEDKNILNFEKAAAQYASLLRNHIYKENNALFFMADNVLDEKEQDIMFEKFEAHEENVIGHGVHGQLHAMIDEWAKVFPID
jgi:hemerythrin-like domain-containing protein